MTSTPHGQFRKDIQGLRAIAVGSVLLYHAGVPGLSGGYAGVDIFFVISGFLITMHLLGQLDRNGRVSFGEFYAKRIRRILPASFVILVLSLVGAVIWYPPILMDEVMGAIRINPELTQFTLSDVSDPRKPVVFYACLLIRS